jgi:hypothetical protein
MQSARRRTCSFSEDTEQQQNITMRIEREEYNIMVMFQSSTLSTPYIPYPIYPMGRYE